MTREIEKFSVREAGERAGTSLQRDAKLNETINGVTGEIAGTDHHNDVKLNETINGVAGGSRLHYRERREEKPVRPVRRSDRQPVCRPDGTNTRGRC